MNQREKAEEIVRQGGECREVSCDFEDENECPIYKACEETNGTCETHPDKIIACREFLGEPIIDNAVIGTPRTNAPVKTLLDEFAMAAMAAIVGKRPYMTVSNGDSDALGTALMIVRSDVNGAYTVAAAMMKERARRDEMGNVKEVE